MATKNNPIISSKFDIHTWLDSISRGVTPTGKRANIIRSVEDGETIRISHSGGQQFGSGGYSRSSRYAGNEPELVEHLEGDCTSFTSDSVAVFRFTAPSIVVVSSGDTIGRGGRDFGTTVYVCATENQIKTASEAVRQQRRDESAEADLSVLKAYVKKCWRDYEDWARRYISNGTCWDSDGTPEYYYHPGAVRVACEAGPGTHEEDQAGRYLRYMPEATLALRRVLYHMDAVARITFFKEIEAEYEAEVKAAQVEFAREQARILQEMGLTTQKAWQLIKIVGAGGAVECFKWVVALQEVHEMSFLKEKLTIIARRSGKFYSWSAMANQFEQYGLQVPPGAYQQMMRNIRGAQTLGLIAKDVKIVAN